MNETQVLKDKKKSAEDSSAAVALRNFRKKSLQAVPDNSHEGAKTKSQKTKSKKVTQPKFKKLNKKSIENGKLMF